MSKFVLFTEINLGAQIGNFMKSFSFIRRGP